MAGTWDVIIDLAVSRRLRDAFVVLRTGPES